eukprot:COSAG04_NODE_6982_length_1215_cov_791.830645_2_plen_159_part_00
MAMGKRGARNKRSRKGRDVLGLKRTIERGSAMDVELPAAAAEAALGATLGATLGAAADAQFAPIAGLSLGKLKKRHVLETRQLRRQLSDLSRLKHKLKNSNPEQKARKKAMGKEMQDLQRELTERHSAEIAFVTRRNEDSRVAAEAPQMEVLSDDDDL